MRPRGEYATSTHPRQRVLLCVHLELPCGIRLDQAGSIGERDGPAASHQAVGGDGPEARHCASSEIPGPIHEDVVADGRPAFSG